MTSTAFPPGADPEQIYLGGSLELHPFFDADGRPHSMDSQFSSTFVTPSGFPVERWSSWYNPWGAYFELTNKRLVNDQTLAADFNVTLYLSGSVGDMYQLITNPSTVSEAASGYGSSQFDYQFSLYGQHIVTMSGSIEDIWGNTYTGGGTYQVMVGREIHIHPGAIPGTPFQVGDSLAPTLRLSPGVPADVTIRLRLYRNSNPDVLEQTITGRANRFGYFHPLVNWETGELGNWETGKFSKSRIWVGIANKAKGGILSSKQPCLGRGPCQSLKTKIHQLSLQKKFLT